MKKYIDPELEMIQITEPDIITTSGFRDDEGELTPIIDVYK